MQTSLMRSVSAVALTMVLAAGASAASLDPAVACGFAKMHAALKASSALNACFRHAIQTGSDPDPACVDAAHATLGTTFAKIDAKGGCSATDDAPSVALLVDRFSEELAQELNGTCLPAGSPCGSITLCCAGLACTVTDPRADAGLRLTRGRSCRLGARATRCIRPAALGVVPLLRTARPDGRRRRRSPIGGEMIRLSTVASLIALRAVSASAAPPLVPRPAPRTLDRLTRPDLADGSKQNDRKVGSGG